MTPTIGRIVHYRLPDRHGAERWRPAMVVQTFGETCNLTIFLDGLNDANSPEDVKALRDSGLGVSQAFASAGSRAEGTGEGNWRWPPRA